VNALEENFEKMIQLFQQYQITPIFIFDGKPPPDKTELLEKRRQKKWEAEDRYNELMKLNQDVQNETIIKELQELKNMSIKISKDHCQRVKTILEKYNIVFYDSTTESDPLCVYFVNSGKAWACLSEDMDMFAYGCKRVLRNFDMETRQVTIYPLQFILNELRIHINDFKYILILSGTDFSQSSSHLYTLMNLHKEYREYREPKTWFKRSPPTTDSDISFYSWLEKFHPTIVHNKTKLQQCFSLFDLNSYKELLRPFYLIPYSFTFVK
jgi:hypothetical protein